MDRCGIEKSVVASIATKPGQFDSILDWCRRIANDRIIPFPSFHPEDLNFSDCIDRIKQSGFKGVKLHPYYQHFVLDDPQTMFPIYEKLQQAGLIVLAHTGFDMAFPHERICEPARVLNTLAHFPHLKFVASHLGAWQDWDTVRQTMIGKPIYMDISLSLEHLSKEQAREMITSHLPDYLLFATDSPWGDQHHALRLLRALHLQPQLEQKILRDNALALLNC